MVHVLAHNKVITVTLSSTRLAYPLLYYILNFDMYTSTIDWEIFTVKIFSLVAIGMKIKHENLLRKNVCMKICRSTVSVL